MKKILALLIGLAFTFAGFAKVASNNDSYNMRRAQEEVESGNTEQAMEFFNKELSDNPKNAYAHLAVSAPLK